MKKVLICSALLATAFAIPAFACSPEPCFTPPPPLCDSTSTKLFQGTATGQSFVSPGGTTQNIAEVQKNMTSTGANGTTTSQGIVGTLSSGAGPSMSQAGMLFAEERTQGGARSLVANQGELAARGEGKSTSVYGQMMTKSTLTGWPGDTATMMTGHGFEGGDTTGAGFIGNSMGNINGMFGTGTGTTGPQ